MTRDCGQHRDDQRLRTIQEMTADLWGGRGSGYLNLTGTRSYFRRVFFFYLTCSSTQPRAVFPVL
ncbi:unnamed protein product [Staurois parvus]|uniref:Uncharacterized protein n=1 Tax=Staurois parvus TaxID=386267 RepID=A0ABN9HKF1_9NEOB|nr:unnamed protein product [Staurois parvus]